MNVRIASPCSAAWADMTPAGASSRHCGTCQQRVYDLSAMTGPQARALIAQTGGDLCVRFYARHDGTVLLQNDCAIGLAAARRDRRERSYGLGFAALATAGLLATGVAAQATTPPPHDLTDAELRALMDAHPRMGKYDGPRPEADRPAAPAPPDFK